MISLRSYTRRFALAAAFALLLAPAARTATVEALEIVARSGTHRFQVELAATNEERARGLMFRRELAADRGMLFDFGYEAPITMWMKNTYIPLDMIFIRGDGQITHIAENTVPHSEATISSQGPAKAVLEVPGGTAKRLGIAPGDRVSHRIFGKR